jgi:membrane associated rhomboid family serine protease
MSNGTQLSKSLSIGHVVTTVGLVIGGFSFIYDLRESVAIQSFQLENVEDRLGRFRFFLFYTICGIFAALLQVWVYPDSKIPLIGASGAISGVLGAYMVFFPRAQIVTLIFIFFFIDIIVLPAALWISLWFLMQFVSALLSVNHLSMGGVAWFAHIGGFLAGVVLAKLFAPKEGYY